MLTTLIACVCVVTVSPPGRLVEVTLLGASIVTSIDIQ